MSATNAIGGFKMVSAAHTNTHICEVSLSRQHIAEAINTCAGNILLRKAEQADRSVNQPVMLI